MQNDRRKRNVNGDDIFDVRWVDAPCLSADGQHLAYTVTYLDRAGDSMRTKIRCGEWEHAGHSPRWSPDGSTLAFIHDDANGIAQVWLWHRHDQAAAPITHLPQACSWPTWSPDGTQIAFLENGQLWVFATDDHSSTALTFGHEAIATPCWLPDSRHIAFTASRQMGSETQVWLCQVNLSQPAPPSLLYTNLGPIRALASAPSGTALGWIGHDRGLAQGVNFGVWHFDLASQTARPLTATFDRSIGLTTRSDDVRGMNPPDLVWLCHHSQNRIYVAYAEGGASHIGWVGLDGTMRPIITGERSCLAFSIASATDSIAAVIATATDPGEVIATDLDGNDEHALTQVNAAWLNEVQLSQHQAMHFVASDGVTVEAWLVKPPLSSLPSSLPRSPQIGGDRGGERYPLILQIHGGPHYAIGHRFYLEFQRLAAQGYIVLFGNARGSQGYGEAFATRIRAAWGERDYADLMEMLDYALHDPQVDPTRLAVTGVSYGGFMTHCIIGRTQRFRVAITENGISNLLSNYDQTTNQLFWQWQLEGTPDQQPARYHALSPIRNAHLARTPLMLIHAEQDINCPIGQSEEMTAALQATGCPTKLVRIPEEGHLMNLVGKPSHRLLRTHALDTWLEQWLMISG